MKSLRVKIYNLAWNHTLNDLNHRIGNGFKFLQGLLLILNHNLLI